MIPLKEWLKSEEYLEMKAKTPGEMASLYFHRDPLRAVHLDPDAFLSPADGTIVYVLNNLGPDKPIVNVKGKKFTVRQALDDESYNYKSIVIGLFMTAFDIHVNRAPTDCFVSKVSRTPYLFTPNISMINEEEALLNEAEIDKDDMGYLFKNERNIIRLYSHDIKGNYFCLQYAEKDVDKCLLFDTDNYKCQGERIGIVRFGSQVDLIIPLAGKVKYEILAKELHHVRAGQDKLLRIIR